MTGPNATIAVGPVLHDAVLLVARHWLILIISLVALGEACLMILGLLGRCFGVYAISCASEWATLGDLPQWVIKTALEQLAAFLVLTVAFYFLFSSPRTEIAESARLRGSTDRTLLFFGRAALAWILILLPIWAIDLAFTRLVELLSVDGMSSTARWSLFLVRTAVITGIAGTLHARMAFYLPSVAYDSTPRSLWECWRRTGEASTRLIAVFVIISVIGQAAQIGLFFLAHRSPLYFGAVDAVSALLGVRSDYVLHNLAQTTATLVTGVPGTLIEAAASMVVFKQLAPAADQSTADVFS